MYASCCECNLISILRRLLVTLRSRGWWYQVIIIEDIPYPRSSISCLWVRSFTRLFVLYRLIWAPGLVLIWTASLVSTEAKDIGVRKGRVLQVGPTLKYTIRPYGETKKPLQHFRGTLIRYSNFAFQIFTYLLEINVGAFIHIFYCLLITWQKHCFFYKEI